MDKGISTHSRNRSRRTDSRALAASVVLHSYHLAATLCLLLSHRSVSGLPTGRVPDDVGIQGMPLCPVGFPACGMHGCYTPLLTQCDPSAGCVPIKLFSQLSAVVRFGGSIEDHIGSCPIGFANACGDRFCDMGDLCVGGTCTSGSGRQTETAGRSAAHLKAACLKARHSVAACAGDISDLVLVDCNGIGVASINSISCFQSQFFNCAVRPGSAPAFSCRGMAGVAQAVTDAWNTTITGAAAMAVEVASAFAKQQHQHASQQAQVLMVGQPTGGLPDADPYGASSGTHRAGGSSSSASHGWRAGANAAWDKLGQAVQEGQPLLQPVFQSLANMVNNASKSLLNITSEMGSPADDRGKIAGSANKQRTFDLGTPPIKDAAGDAPQHLLVVLTVAMVTAAALFTL